MHRWHSKCLPHLNRVGIFENQVLHHLHRSLVRVSPPILNLEGIRILHYHELNHLDICMVLHSSVQRKVTFLVLFEIVWAGDHHGTNHIESGRRFSSQLIAQLDHLLFFIRS